MSSIEKPIVNKNIKLPAATQVIVDGNFDYYVTVGIFKNFNGYTKANFVSDAAVHDDDETSITNFQLQDLFYSAHHFDKDSEAIDIAEKFFQYYETNSQLFAVYGIKQGKESIVWYQEGFFDYLSASKAEYGNNWFFGPINSKKLGSEFGIDKAQIILLGNLDEDKNIPSLGVFPRNLLISRFDKSDSNEMKTTLYKLERKASFDTLISRLARLYSQYFANKYDPNKRSLYTEKVETLLSHQATKYELDDHLRNEAEVPEWVRTVYKYGRND